MADCENKLKSLLPWYLNRTLSAEEAKKVEAHLKECPECQKELEELRWLSSGVKEHKEVFASPHIESEKLVIFFEEPEILATEERTTIERHLPSCPACYEELQTLKRANLELAALEKKEEPKFVKEASVWERISERLTWLVRKPAFAYIIVVLLAYPAYRGIFMGQRAGVKETAYNSKSAYLEETLRTGVEKVPEISIDPKVRILNLVFFYPVSTQADFRYDLELFDSQKNLILSIEDYKDYSPEGNFILPLNTRVLRPGEYRLILVEQHRKNPLEKQQAFFMFTLSKR